MNRDLAYPIAVIMVVAIVTLGLRAVPFIIFGNRSLPKSIQYLGRVLPPTIMTVLVIYCLRNTSFAVFPFGIPEIISCVLVVIIQFIRNNMYLSIIIGTFCYMFLIRVF